MGLSRFQGVTLSLDQPGDSGRWHWLGFRSFQPKPSHDSGLPAAPGPRAVFNPSSPAPLPAALPSGDALLDAGESMKRLAEVKDSLDIEVKQNFIDPLQNLCDKDLKEIQVNIPPLTMIFSPPHLSVLWGCWCTELSALEWWEPGAGRNSLHSVCVFSPSRLSGISSLLSAAPAAPEQPKRLDAGWNGSPFAMFDGG